MPTGAPSVAGFDAIQTFVRIAGQRDAGNKGFYPALVSARGDGAVFLWETGPVFGWNDCRDLRSCEDVRIARRQLQLHLLVILLQRRRPQIDGTLDPSVVVLTDAEPDHGLIHLIDEDSDVLLLATDDADEGHLRFLRLRGRGRRRRADDGGSRDDRRRRRTPRDRKKRTLARRAQVVERDRPERIGFAGSLHPTGIYIRPGARSSPSAAASSLAAGEYYLG
jgi:hypothetical protein